MTPRKPPSKKPVVRRPGKAFVGIAGNIGSGKSSLTRLLSERTGWAACYESVDDNPYLDDFYADMPRWSFELQVYFLSHRFRSHKAIVEGRRSVILDRVIYEDAEIFARTLFELGKMDERDYRTYVALYGVMTDYLRPPDLLVYLKASVPTLQRQIAARGRGMEQGIQRDYLERLNMRYEEWIGGYTLGKVLTVEVDSTDFVNRPADLDKVTKRIERALR
ncbi:MAG: deoxynucleoside kinase [Proteobacteria bacterium]|nr:deoxynucleoside kinase [Pseudomonadota bacterium]